MSILSDILYFVWGIVIMFMLCCIFVLIHVGIRKDESAMERWRVYKYKKHRRSPVHLVYLIVAGMLSVITTLAVCWLAYPLR